MDVLHGDLKPVEAPGLGDLDFGAKLLGQVLGHYAVTGREECQNILDEVPFIGGQFLPVGLVLSEVYFVGSPEGGEVLFVHGVDVVVLDGEQHEPLLVVLQDGFWELGVQVGAELEVGHRPELLLEYIIFPLLILVINALHPALISSGLLAAKIVK